MTPPLVSVIVPCYNGARFLPDAVASLQAQTHQLWECVIIDDGSSDDTNEIAKRLSRQDPRVHYVWQRNRGIAAARNRGLAEVSGKYIQFLDADDVILPSKFERQLALITDVSLPSVLSCDYELGEHGTIQKTVASRLRTKLEDNNPLHDLIINWETRLSIPCHCFLFDVRLFRQFGIRFNEGLRNHEDWDCWMDVFALNVYYRHLSEVLAIYRLSEGSVCGNPCQMRRGFVRAIKGQLASQDSPSTRELLQEKLQEIGKLYYASSWQGKLRNRVGRSPLGVPWRRFKFRARNLFTVRHRPSGTQTEDLHSNR